jgi:hypothetical protein
MRKLLVKTLTHPGRVLLVEFFLLAVFVFSVASAPPCGLSVSSLGRAVETALTLLLAIDSPAKMLENRSAFIVGYGWMICLMGWLFLPLLFGVLVDISVGRAEAYSKLRLMFRDLGVSAHLKDGDLKRFADQMMESVERILAGAKDS